MCSFFIHINAGYSEKSTRGNTFFNVSPDDITVLLHEKPDNVYFKKKDRLNPGIVYTTLTQYSKSGKPHQNASGGDFDLFSTWSICNKHLQNSLIGARLEQRHRFSSIAPRYFNTMIHTVVPTTKGFNQFDAALTELWWENNLTQETLIGLRVGKLDFSTLINSYAFNSQKQFFLNDIFTGAPSIAQPNNALGLVAGLRNSANYYAAISVADTNGDKTTSGFNTFFHYGQFFKSIELGYRDKLHNTRADNYHLLLWQSDPSAVHKLPSDSGIALLLQKNINQALLPFISLSVSHGHATLLKRMINTGIGIFNPFNDNEGELLGLGAGYVTPSDTKKQPEIVLETFYRMTFHSLIEITPDIQLIRLNRHNTEHWVTVGSLRFRAIV